MRKPICLLFMLGLAIFVKAQDGKRDSLLKLLPLAKEDTARVMLLLEIADLYETNNQDSSIYFLEQSKRLSTSLKFTKGLYTYYNQSAIVSFTKGDYAIAAEQHKEALNYARQLKDSSRVIAILGNMAIVYSYLGDFQKQLEYSLQVRKASEETGDSAKLSGIYHGLANAYINLKQYRRSADFALLSLRIHTEFKKRNDYINRVYATLAQDYEGMKMTDSALFYYEKAKQESVLLNDKYAEGIIYGYLSNLYAANNQFEKMQKSAEKSLELARELQSRQMVASSLYDLAYANFLNGNNAKAKKGIYEALEIASNDSLRDELRNIYLVLSYIAARDGDFETSMMAKKKTDSLQEAVLNEQVVKSTTELEKKYESEKKDKQIKLQQAQLQRRRIFSYILIASVFVILVISFLISRNYKQKQRLQRQRISELEKEKQLASAEAVLKGEEQERTRLAKDLHDGLGGIMSGIKYSLQTMKRNLVMTAENQQAYERSMDMLDSSINEMRRVAHNLMPEVLVKYGLDTALNEFCSDVNQSGALQVSYQSIGMDKLQIDQTPAITIYRIVQELINNTMKHAAAKTAIVQVSNTNSMITVTVEDDGKGFDPDILRLAKGIGWSNIKSRLGYLGGKLDVRSEPGKGTSVHIELNI